MCITLKPVISLEAGVTVVLSVSADLKQWAEVKTKRGVMRDPKHLEKSSLC